MIRRRLAIRSTWLQRTCTIVFMTTMVPSIIYAQGQVLNLSLTHAGYERSYYLYVPSGYAPGNSTPVVFNIHGWDVYSPYLSGADQMAWTGMNTVAEREGFLTVYPDCYREDGGPGVGWLGPNGTNQYDDVGFFDAMIADLSSQYTVDASRVYVTGLSFGGLMTYVLSAARPYTYAAAAPVAGDRPYSPGTTDYAPLNVPNTPGRPIPLLHIHGTADQAIRYYGGGAGGWTFPPVEQVVGKYAVNNGADSTPSIADLSNINTSDYSTVQLLTYGNPNAYVDAEGNSHAAETLFYRVVNGGHNWPDMVPPERNPPVNRDINANEVIWEFFSSHVVAMKPLPGDYNGDSVVDSLDYDTWRSMFGSPSGAYAGADGNGDGIVDAADYAVWRDHFSDSTTSSGSAISIPEPTSLTVVLIASVAMVGFRRRRAFGDRVRLGHLFGDRWR